MEVLFSFKVWLKRIHNTELNQLTRQKHKEAIKEYDRYVDNFYKDMKAINETHYKYLQ